MPAVLKSELRRQQPSIDSGSNGNIRRIYTRLKARIKERRNEMPTFNQLVRQGRKQPTYKSTSPALQRGLNTLENKATALPSPQ